MGHGPALLPVALKVRSGSDCGHSYGSDRGHRTHQRFHTGREVAALMAEAKWQIEEWEGPSPRASSSTLCGRPAKHPSAAPTRARDGRCSTARNRPAAARREGPSPNFPVPREGLVFVYGL